MDIKKFAKAKHKDKLKGGKADAKSPKEFDKKQLEAGTKVEMEHTNDRSKAKEIAMDHLTEDPNYYKKLKTIHVEKSNKSKEEFIQKFKKSYDWRDVQTTVDANDHKAAEQSIPRSLIEHIRTCATGDINKIAFAKGTLTLSKVAAGLYSGFFQGLDGQVLDKYEPTTLEIVAKNLMVKNLYDGMPETVEATVPAQLQTASAEVAKPVAVEAPHADKQADEKLIAERVNQAMQMHNEVFHQGQAPFEPVSGKGSLKLKYGNFELEIKKSIQDFVKSAKAQKTEQKEELRKALSAWRRNSAKQFTSDTAAAEALIKHWDSHSESFNQILFALEQLKKKQNEQED